MKKFLILFLLGIIFVSPVMSSVDKTSEEYLKNSQNPSTMSFIAENAAKAVIKKQLKKEAPGKYKVKLKGYSLTSLKNGIFKYLEITGKNITAEGIRIPYYNIRTITDYNYIDYKQNPVVFRSDIKFDCEVHLSEKSINDALQTDDYSKVLIKINQRVFPFITINNVKVKLEHNKMRIFVYYNFPLSPREKDNYFVVSTGLGIVNNEIKAKDISYDKAYSNLPINKLINLINTLNPLNFTVKLLDSKKCQCKIEKIKIIDDIVIINGKIFIEGDK